MAASKFIAATAIAVLIALVSAILGWELLVHEDLTSAEVPVARVTTYVLEPNLNGYEEALKWASGGSLGSRGGWVEDDELKALLLHFGDALPMSSLPPAGCHESWTAESEPSLSTLIRSVSRILADRTARWPRGSGLRPRPLANRMVRQGSSQEVLGAVRVLRALTCEVFRVHGDAEALAAGWLLTSLLSQRDDAWYMFATELRGNLARAAIRRACSDSDFRGELAKRTRELAEFPLLDPRSRVSRARLLTLANLVLPGGPGGKPAFGDVLDKALLLKRINEEYSSAVGILEAGERYEQVLENVRARAAALQRQIVARKSDAAIFSIPFVTPRERVVARTERIARIMVDVELSGLEHAVVSFATANRWEQLVLSVGERQQMTCSEALEVGANRLDPPRPWVIRGRVRQEKTTTTISVGDQVLDVAKTVAASKGS